MTNDAHSADWPNPRNKQALEARKSNQQRNHTIGLEVLPLKDLV